jgi:hypothetical protein
MPSVTSRLRGLMSTPDVVAPAVGSVVVMSAV